ncbi:hypothetical protein [Ideonella paludis]|uniref:Uncharacterized protein n=1 Tax=Ideonella paludis TaxID=1233411 RepID=A0ABS5DXA4_9BURK|nr:hypothetical protein [Ideonella paludis]MBQ0935704.1 hypothetical protein [Ideonella paludis]
MHKPVQQPVSRPWLQVVSHRLARGWAALRKLQAQRRASPTAQPSPGAVSMAAAAQCEAWLDMEQLVDFYMALGMTSAAVDTLTEHLKAADWAGPLPYLKLMEIHAQDDNRNAYLLTKTLLEQRYAMAVPDWPRAVASASRPARLQGTAPGRPRPAKLSPRNSTRKVSL